VDIDIGKELARIRFLRGLSKRQLAAMAGVSASTVMRIENGDVDPTMGTITRLFEAAGCEFRGEVVEQSDPSAVAAARSVLEPASGLEAFPGAQVWLDRWIAAGVVKADEVGSSRARSPRDLAEIAGLTARLARRPGIVTFRREGSWSEIARRIDLTGVAWAATGGAAANRLSPSATAPWPVFYVADVKAVAELAGFSERDPDRKIQEVMSLIPFDGVADVGVSEDEYGLRWVDPIQVIIDCFGGTGRMPDQADALADFFDSKMMANA
jgi:transcriptional regulator with XRE-family HTH domain